jgi:hypothetical protein
MPTDVLRRTARAARVLNSEQRMAACGALLLIVGTLGSFSFVEGGQLVLAIGVLLLLLARAEGARFHLPFGDGSVILSAGVWAGALILAGLLDRGILQNVFGAAGAAILFVAGGRERSKRPADDVPAGFSPRERGEAAPAEGERLRLAPQDREDAQA